MMTQNRKCQKSFNMLEKASILQLTYTKMQPLPDNNEALFRIKEGKSQLKGAADGACVYMFLKEKSFNYYVFEQVLKYFSGRKQG